MNLNKGDADSAEEDATIDEGMMAVINKPEDERVLEPFSFTS
jgi:hypothetical protein